MTKATEVQPNWYPATVGTHFAGLPLKQPQLTHDERCAGRKADYLVYYRDARGKLFYQAVYAGNMVEAADWLRKAVPSATIVRTLVRACGREVGAL